MKYFVGNTLCLIAVAGFLIWLVWEKTALHWGSKTALTIFAFFFAAFFVERVASKWVNKLIQYIVPDK